jgi:hypothetical protein
MTNGGRTARWFASFCLRALYIFSVSITTNLFTFGKINDALGLNDLKIEAITSI